MLFNSFEFLVFFPLVTILFFLLPHRFRWLHLLLASCAFYMAFIPAYILILFLTIVIDYIAGIMIENAQGAQRKFYLAMSLVANIGVLAVFKYYNFFIDNVNALLHLSNPTASLPLLAIILPIGLSFHTFQAMSYTIEVYRGHQAAERHFGIYSLYVMFYPQLVAGPIERPQNVLHQFHEKQYFDYRRVVSGLRLMAWGLFKKVVIADRLAYMVNAVYNNPHDFHGLPVLVSTLFFSIQIYCDFSGYSDMALGAARVMGFELMKNFDRPYFSESVGEFWRRWHISLSTWFKDYLYISLGGNRVPLLRACLNTFIVFMVSGLWHGANWTFIVWGALHGLFLVVGRLTKARRIAFIERTNLHFLNNPLLNTGLTYVLVAFAWIFFRANTLQDAGYVINNLFTTSSAYWKDTVFTGLSTVKIFYTRTEWLALLGALILLFAVEKAQFRLSINNWLVRQSTPVRWAIYQGIVLYIVLLGAFEHVQFIYFQF
ncbi:MBOAT family O-acyltransferase [Hymenobacter chitinivorans]|uniref:D-alanyl-lipoteichoic acid acyltransferase DltB (MBOAT superfamily) n=1 Tax=Hymenobacter chitinivorans DSM 11115 TaxID=1121954 RepID=A0A2M9BQ37_9BACT|nr:MBOAT family O-acyltransferase [Hymenobacter chitinivorans]PJJ60012.1 D-alanyl-lipoteichoic acid acyltransferase DltB (MBOAT superfamily) [Hymenobacter chitinivorans DSM 11115]